mgnify:CR=1 FL=1
MRELFIFRGLPAFVRNKYVVTLIYIHYCAYQSCEVELSFMMPIYDKERFIFVHFSSNYHVSYKKKNYKKKRQSICIELWSMQTCVGKIHSCFFSLSTSYIFYTQHFMNEFFCYYANVLKCYNRMIVYI